MAMAMDIDIIGHRYRLDTGIDKIYIVRHRYRYTHSDICFSKEVQIQLDPAAAWTSVSELTASEHTVTSSQLVRDSSCPRSAGVGRLLPWHRLCSGLLTSLLRGVPAVGSPFFF